MRRPRHHAELSVPPAGRVHLLQMGNGGTRDSNLAFLYTYHRLTNPVAWCFFLFPSFSYQEEHVAVAATYDLHCQLRLCAAGCQVVRTWPRARIALASERFQGSR